MKPETSIPAQGAQKSRPNTADPSTDRGTGVGGPHARPDAADCVFCAILREDVPVGLITEWPDAIAIHPLNPVVEGHILIIPRVHVEDFASDWHVTSVAAGRASEFVSRLREPMDFNLITSKGAAATQTVYHLHVHLVPRRSGDGLALPWTGQTDREAARPVHYREAAKSLRVLLDGLLPIDDRTMGLRYAATRLERTAQDLEGDTDA